MNEEPGVPGKVVVRPPVPEPFEMYSLDFPVVFVKSALVLAAASPIKDISFQLKR
jgi:hypothetical protein